MNALIKEMTAEAAEIISNIRTARLNGEITYQQSNELMKLVDADMTAKLTLAKNLLHDWTGKYDLPRGA